MNAPNMPRGLHHVALKCSQFEASLHFYHTIIGMAIVWQPDADNVYLSLGTDNLALHRAPSNFNAPPSQQRLDHIGFVLATREDVFNWFDYLKLHTINIKALPKDHRDHTCSFYCADPDGNTVQFIYIPFSATNIY